MKGGDAMSRLCLRVMPASAVRESLMVGLQALCG